MEDKEIPMGLGMALAQNLTAMEKFAALPDSKKAEIIGGAHSVSSKEEMRRYVENIISLY